MSPQPLERDGNILQWNGEVFGGIDVSGCLGYFDINYLGINSHDLKVTVTPKPNFYKIWFSGSIAPHGWPVR